MSIIRSAAGPPTIRNIVGMISSISGMVKRAGSWLARCSI